MTPADVQHRVLEASRLAFADRGAYIADRRFFVVPRIGLLSKDFAATRRPLIGDRAGTSPAAPGDPYPFNGAPASRAGEPSVTSTRAGTTTHITVADKRGDVVSYTFTIESTGGAGLVVPGYGFLLNNELTDFNFTSRTHPNRVQAGKRPRSSMAPTIVLRGGRPWLGLGSPGGSTIITTVLGLLVERIDRGTYPAARHRGAAREPARHAGDDRRARVPQVAGGGGPRRRAGTRSRPWARSVPRPGSSWAPAGRWWRRPSRCGAVAAARSWRRASADRRGRSARRG